MDEGALRNPPDGKSINEIDSSVNSATAGMRLVI